MGFELFDASRLGEDGDTLLIKYLFWANRPQVDVIRTLLHAADNINYSFENMSALFACVMNLTADISVIKFLCVCGADVNQKNAFGETIVSYLY